MRQPDSKFQYIQQAPILNLLACTHYIWKSEGYKKISRAERANPVLCPTLKSSAPSLLSRNVPGQFVHTHSHTHTHTHTHTCHCQPTVRYLTLVYQINRLRVNDKHNVHNSVVEVDLLEVRVVWNFAFLTCVSHTAHVSDIGCPSVCLSVTSWYCVEMV